MVKATLINFGSVIYEGESVYDAMNKVEKAGFEATVENQFDGTFMSYSPIGGWKFF